MTLAAVQGGAQAAGRPVGGLAQERVGGEQEHRCDEEQCPCAVDEALARGVPHPNAVRLALERRREAPPPLGVPLPAHLKTRDVTVRAHPLAGYDRLLEDDHDDA